MPIEVTINFDAGCFFPAKLVSGNALVELGYFQNPTGVPDIRVFIDSSERLFDPPLKLGDTNSIIDVRQRYADDSLKRDGPTWAGGFAKQILALTDLYGEQIEIDRAKFDCMFRFETGRFLPSMVKARAFKECRRTPEGLFAATGTMKEIFGISHNAIVHFILEDRESLELVSDGKTFLSSADLCASRRIEIELPIDNSIGNKFYADGFVHERQTYWLPNDGDPPPFFPGGATLTLPGVPSSPAPIFECPHGDFQQRVSNYDRHNPPRCPNDNELLVRKR